MIWISELDLATFCTIIIPYESNLWLWEFVNKRELRPKKQDPLPRTSSYSGWGLLKGGMSSTCVWQVGSLRDVLRRAIQSPWLARGILWRGLEGPVAVECAVLPRLPRSAQSCAEMAMMAVMAHGKRELSELKGRPWGAVRGREGEASWNHQKGWPCLLAVLSFLVISPVPCLYLLYLFDFSLVTCFLFLPC